MSEHPQFPSSNRLVYDQAARNFNEALPIGNGRLGAMIYGGNGLEKVSLNEDTLWAGGAAPKPRPEAAAALPEIRRLLFSGARDAAEKLIERDQLTEFNQPYLPAGDLLIRWPDALHDADTLRSLDLNDAVANVVSTAPGLRVTRSYFVSAVDQVITIQAESDGKPLSNVQLNLQAKLQSQVAASESEIVLSGRAPSDVFWEDVGSNTTAAHRVSYDADISRHYVIVLHAISKTGSIDALEDSLSITNASDFTILVAIATGDRLEDALQMCRRTLSKATAKSMEDIRKAHIEDYGALFNRTKLQFKAAQPTTALTTDQRLQRFSVNRDDPALFSQLFDLARYLMISSSRAGTMPANLQGIWNEDIMPPWWSNYTININTEMNYWPAEVCGLGSCHTALIDFICDLAMAGRETAQVHFGCHGWVVCHQTDFRRQTTPVGFRYETTYEGPAKWAMWPFGGAWLSLHLFEHFRYGNDREFLRERAYPVMKGAAEFLCDWLIDDPQNPGTLTTAPSTSPENTYRHPDGYDCAIGIGSAIDISIARALFKAVLAADRELGGSDSDFAEVLKAKLSALPELKLTDDGRIMEFDQDWPEAEHPHRHISQLFALCPGNEISLIDTPELARAAVRTLDARGDSGTGWSLVWKAMCWIRLGEGERAYELLCKVLKPLPSDTFTMGDTGGGIYPNLLTACPPFQIEANFGLAAALSEMIVQDHCGPIHLLPALPDALASGNATDLHLRDQLRLNISWHNGALISAVVSSATTQQKSFWYRGQVCKIDFTPNVKVEVAAFFTAKMAVG